MSLEPRTIEEVQHIVREAACVQPVGGGTKPGLSGPLEGVTQVRMAGLTGIITYQPSEYTFTAYAGTPIAEVAAALAEHQQYMPFDPLLGEQGATLGGTLAANLSGPGRYRYGGLRDFILGIRFVDGLGRLVRGGGQVVKNAAGFDLPKFFTGSLGRYGILVELSFKVFPRPAAYQTLHFNFNSVEEAMARVFSLSGKPLEIDALDIEVTSAGAALIARLGGLEEALSARAERLQKALQTRARIISGAEDAAYWRDQVEMAWAQGRANVAKFPVAPRLITQLEAALTGHMTARRYTSGGNVGWAAGDDLSALAAALNAHELAGLRFIGAPGQPIIGARQGEALARRIKHTLDPEGKFPEI